MAPAPMTVMTAIIGMPCIIAEDRAEREPGAAVSATIAAAPAAIAAAVTLAPTAAMGVAATALMTATALRTAALMAPAALMTASMLLAGVLRDGDGCGQCRTHHAQYGHGNG
ncbi:MAG: hypothetical protein P4M09_30420 [Devosia sp.]|nr:hypothetical protein [Devosia sp.]